MQRVDGVTRGQLAIAQIAQAIATYYGEPLEAVVGDAVRLVGASALDAVHPEEHKVVLTYLAGRLCLPS